MTRKKKVIEKTIIDHKIPCMGNIIIEPVKQARSDYEKKLAQGKGVSEDFLKDFTIVADSTQASYAPIHCGRVIKIANDAYGIAYEKRYGIDNAKVMREGIKVGTLVYFVPNQSYRIDETGKYHMIRDDHVQLFENEEIIKDKDEQKEVA